MTKNIIILILLFVTSLTGCSTFNAINEKAKGDGVPYLPGI